MDPNSTRPERDGPSPQPADQPGGVASSEPGPPQGRGHRNLLTCGVLFLALCLVSSVIGFVLYDRATRKDRSTPNVVVFQYVDAIFDQRDPSEADLFECEDSVGRAALEDLLREVEERERRFDIRINVSTGTVFNTSIQGTDARVTVNLILSAPEANGDTSQSSETWQFDLRDEDGWRICGSREVP